MSNEYNEYNEYYGIKDSNNLDIDFKIRTYIDPDFKTIVQKYKNIIGQIITLKMDTSELQIRQALIELGWTPPEGK